MNKATGFSCPKCSSRRAHNIHAFLWKGTQPVSMTLSCQSCEFVWEEDLTVYDFERLRLRAGLDVSRGGQ